MNTQHTPAREIEAILCSDFPDNLATCQDIIARSKSAVTSAIETEAELLAACQELVKMVDELLPLAPQGCGWGTLATDQARQAIAKATGQEG